MLRCIALPFSDATQVLTWLNIRSVMLRWPSVIYLWAKIVRKCKETQPSGDGEQRKQGKEDQVGKIHKVA